MVWQAVVLAVQILLLATGWLLFQRARGELSAQAAETPVLTEAKVLQSSVKQLLAEIDATAERQSLRIEEVCSEAGVILAALESMIQDAESCLARLEPMIAAGSARPTPGETHAVTRTDRSGAPAAQNIQKSNAGSRGKARQETEPPSSNDSSTSGTARDTVVNRRELVFALADSGQSPAAIARATRLSEGEVETLLGLRIQR